MSRLFTLEKTHHRKIVSGGTCFTRCPEQTEPKTPYKLGVYSCAECMISYDNMNSFEEFMRCLDSIL